MIIDELTLVGYKRFVLSGMNAITIRPTKQMQVLIGTNGCGKSSLLSELSPLPGDRKDYVSGGRKFLRCRHNGSVYELTSSFGEGGQEHFFVKDGEELNDGHTLYVQRELVKKFFGITPEIHAIMLGKILFTQMSPQDRRRWITALARNDYTFALNLFNHYKTKARDAQGVVKHLAERITVETNKLHGLGEVTGLETKVQQLNDELRVLLMNRKEGIESEPFDPHPILMSLEDDIEYCKQIMPYVPNGKTYRCFDDVEADIETLERECVRHSDFKHRYAEEHVLVEDTIQKVLKLQTGDGKTTTIEEALATLKQRIDEKRSTFQRFEGIQNAAAKFTDLRQALPSIVELFQLLPDNTDGRFDKARLERLKERIASATVHRDSLKDQLGRLEYRIESFEQMGDVTCPSCQYVWKPGYSETERDRLHNAAGKIRDDLGTLQGRLDDAVNSCHEMEEVSQLYRQLRTLVNAYPSLRDLWDFVIAEKMHLNNPRGNIQVFYQYEWDASVQAELDELLKEQKELEELKMNPQASSELGYLYTRLNDLDRRVFEHTEALRLAEDDLFKVRSYYGQLLNLSNCIRSIEEKVNIIRSRTTQEIDRLRNHHIDLAMAQRHGELAGVQTLLSDKIMVTTILDDLNKSYKETEMEVLINRTLARAMSPTEGVTADQLMAPLRAIVGRVNAIIAKVWTYEMVVLPSRPEDDGELDYKFPISMPEHEGSTPDISQSSKSQTAMINFAFRLVVKHYLKLHDYPYYLDELEDGFDDTHRPNLIGFIQYLMETHPSTQVFMVSHYYSTYGSLSSPQICVLDDANVSVPETYNEHVTFL